MDAYLFECDIVGYDSYCATTGLKYKGADVRADEDYGDFLRRQSG